MKRQIIKIDDEKCNGCGLCVPNCPEGALQIIDGKARLISDLFCDGLGACIGNCPENAITTEERDAEPYNEARVIENIIAAGPNTIKAHLKHLLEHGEFGFYQKAKDILTEKGIPVPEIKETNYACASGCPGSATQTIPSTAEVSTPVPSNLQSHLRQWPIQLQLINPNAAYFDDADLLIAADCVPFAYANFHERFVKGKIVITFCPKLDQTIDQYIQKLAAIIQNHQINSITIARMEVPCCCGTEIIVQRTIEMAGKAMMVKVNVISIKGEIL
ncbi:4Fe-4S binding protein [bacterium]|nr:4Fe-4S binding protein [bacterium]MBU1063879.1 4Fe-4S binding protein [bacterium]MBU1635718.1 4Fe-4S binding protein [bacterium]MBU1873767.1 4Fe-4S binding protein [bacterium]